MKVHNPDNTAVNTNSDPSPNDLKVQGQALFSFEFPIANYETTASFPVSYLKQSAFFMFRKNFPRTE